MTLHIAMQRDDFRQAFILSVVIDDSLHTSITYFSMTENKYYPFTVFLNKCLVRLVSGLDNSIKL